MSVCVARLSGASREGRSSSRVSLFRRGASSRCEKNSVAHERMWMYLLRNLATHAVLDGAAAGSCECRA